MGVHGTIRAANMRWVLLGDRHAAASALFSEAPSLVVGGSGSKRIMPELAVRHLGPSVTVFGSIELKLNLRQRSRADFATTLLERVVTRGNVRPHL